MENSFDIINNLSDTAFIGGQPFTFVYNVYDENGTPVDLSGATISWKASPYGQPDIVSINKSGTITGTSTFIVVLTPTDTATLSGKFAHQPRVVAFDGTLYLPGQGILTIVQKIETT